MKTKFAVRRFTRLIVAVFFFVFGHCAWSQINPPPPAERLLDSWTFDDSTFDSDAGYAPLALTNISFVTNTNAYGRGGWLLLDTTNTTPAYLRYNTVQSDGTTNLVCTNATISLWFSPSWSSTNAGGTGGGSWGRLFETGTYTTNASVGWLSLYLSPDGGTVYFAGQTNNGNGGVYLSAPVTLTNTNWYNFVVTYGPTNSALYLNGEPLTNGGGAAWYPGPSVLTNGFSFGSSASDGLSQARGMFGNILTYNYQWDSNSVYLTYALYAAGSYGGGVSASDYLSSGPSSPGTVPVFNAVTGPGYFTNLISSNSGGGTSSNVWLTNVSATMGSNQTVTVTFSVGGGSNNTPYDVFATAALASPMVNSTWVWLGEVYHNCTYSLPVQSNNVAFLILGTPQMSYPNGLTDAYEWLVWHKNPAISTGDGILDGWAVLWGLTPNIDPAGQPGLRANFSFDGSPELRQVTGIRGETFTVDAEGNISNAH